MRTTDADGLHTLGRWTTDRAASTPQRVAIDDRGVELTYAQLDRRATALADRLLRSGYAPGDRLATLTGNSADHVVVLFACAKAGLVLVPLSWRLSPRELAEQVADSDPAVLLVEEEFGALARATLDLVTAPVPVTRMGEQGVEQAPPPPGGSRPADLARRPVRDDDPLLIIFTSGTSGRARGAVLTHANCFWTNLSLSRTAEITSRDVVLALMPQFHVGGWNVQPLLAWWMGATVVLERTFDAGRVLHLIGDRAITTTMGVPATYLMLAEHPDFDSADLSSLRHAIVGGAPMPEPLLRTWHRRGVALTQGYGLTEAAPNVLCLPPEEATRRVGMAGTPYPHVDVELVDPVTGEVVEGAGTGELVVRGPNVFAGYFREPDHERAEQRRRRGLHTGDLATRDADGYYRIVDRLKDIFISGGESVAPAEIEHVLLTHPGVADAAAVGVPDEQWGEVCAAFVVLRPGVPTDEQDLREHCATRLASFKVPRHLQVVTEIPRSSSSKILRRVLASAWAAPQRTAVPDREVHP
ncbi:Long-chain-fatty-acid--CoA ligase [Nocardioides dokdonensis FR1436]|uniref:Long-chain-fatty-acid--CoA ligase n=1 Tax=Nocardioides dokdonensis FR1436 TaxID=1300347 RepID=A0A1A9GK36_9ACTN|nr:AMP-binding protein [Nocardioides dokdonensis]ANH38649.1 Long-chain-fatty-acid--CoA ligase [Nocardioides dokdonensis FR1436]